MPQPAVLIYNPRAGRWRVPSLVDPVIGELLAAGSPVTAVATAAPGHATELARRAAAAGAPAVYAFGGDGTLRETAAGLLGTEVPLGALPGGTTNVVVRALGLPLHPLAAAHALAHAASRPLDVGLCGREAFLMQVSAGLDAVVLGRVPAGAKRLLGRALVGAVALREWLRYGFPSLTLLADGHPLEATFFAVCNLPLYAGSFALAPRARPDDRRLELVLFRGETRAATLAFVRDLALGRHLERPDVSQVGVGEVTLPGRRLVQLDGDAVEIADATVRLAEHRLLVLAP